MFVWYLYKLSKVARGLLDPCFRLLNSVNKVRTQGCIFYIPPSDIKIYTTVKILKPFGKNLGGGNIPLMSFVFREKP